MSSLQDLELEKIRPDQGLGHQNRTHTEGFESQLWPKIKKYFNKNSRVLDVGCGNGRFSKVISQHVDTVDAIDPWISLLPEHQAANIYYFKTGVDEYEGRDYDVAFLFGVFYSFGFPKNIEVFEKLLSLVKEGGRIIIADAWEHEGKHYDMEKYSKHYGALIEEHYSLAIEEAWEHNIWIIKK